MSCHLCEELLLSSWNFCSGLNDSEPLGVTCKHGPLECAGNAILLCLFEHLPLPDFLGILACQNFQTPFPGDIGKVSLARQCAEASKVDWWGSGVGQCVQGKKAKEDDGKKAEEEEEKIGKEGGRLLRDNAAETQRRGIERACRIEIGSTLVQGGQRVCVVDNHTWAGCDVSDTAQDVISRLILISLGRSHRSRLHPCNRRRACRSAEAGYWVECENLDGPKQCM